MNNSAIRSYAAAVLTAALLVPAVASAGLVLDTGAPASGAQLMNLDGSDFAAAAFALGAGQTITDIQAYITNGASADSPGDTFTVALYASDLTTNRFSAPLYATQGSYQQDGWNDINVSALNWTVSSGGTYWVALEVNAPGDTAVTLTLPVTASGGGTAPALAFAFNNSGQYTSQGAMPFGIQVTAVPLPAAAWLLGGGLLGLGFTARRVRNS